MRGWCTGGKRICEQERESSRQDAQDAQDTQGTQDTQAIATPSMSSHQTVDHQGILVLLAFP